MKTSIKSGFLPKIAAAMVAGGLAFGAQADILIGSSLSTTGMASFLGEPEEETLRMLVEDINEAGGVLGEKLRVIIYDDAGDANKARTFGTRLIEDDEVIAIIGGSTTGATMAIMPIAEEEEIPFISLAGAIEVIDPVRKYTFKTPHTDRMACEKIFEDMQKQGITQIGLIRSEEHTSELQSRGHLVCRLLLEKKK